jgi:hypothetical protein
MIRDVFWLTDEQLARLEPLLPKGRGASHGSTIAG